MTNTQLEFPLLTVAQIRALEQALFNTQDSYAVMQCAAQGIFDTLMTDFPRPRMGQSVHIVLGSGNNAGDGLVLAALLKRQGFVVHAYRLFSHPYRGDALRAYDSAVAAGVDISNFTPFACSAEDIIVDALFGIGFDRPATGDVALAIRHINACKAEHPSIYVYAIDIPSGIVADTGAALGEAVRADKTVTFIGDKIGLHTGDGKGCAGEVVIDDLGATALTECAVGHVECCRYAYTRPQSQPVNTDNAHKGDFGHVLTIGGGRGMFGAAALAAVSALKAGAGKSSLHTHPDYAAQFHLDDTPLYEVMRCEDLSTMSTYNAMVLGVGLGRKLWGKSLFKQSVEAIANAQQLSTSPTQSGFQQLAPALVIDADGLWHLPTVGCAADIAVITPHEAEASRLLHCTVEAIRADKVQAVKALAQRYACIAVLKGAGTLISDGERVWVNTTGNVCLATAGAGDVLAGMIAGYLAQGLNPCQAACYGVFRHGLASDDYFTARQNKSLRASELWDFL